MWKLCKSEEFSPCYKCVHRNAWSEREAWRSKSFVILWNDVEYRFTMQLMMPKCKLRVWYYKFPCFAYVSSLKCLVPGGFMNVHKIIEGVQRNYIIHKEISAESSLSTRFSIQFQSNFSIPKWNHRDLSMSTKLMEINDREREKEI